MFETFVPGVNPWNEQTHQEIAANAPKVTEAVKRIRKVL
jgi:hypothetical protein